MRYTYRLGKFCCARKKCANIQLQRNSD